jgi:hypothetical protein
MQHNLRRVALGLAGLVGSAPALAQQRETATQSLRPPSAVARDPWTLHEAHTSAPRLWAGNSSVDSTATPHIAVAPIVYGSIIGLVVGGKIGQTIALQRPCSQDFCSVSSETMSRYVTTGAVIGAVTSGLMVWGVEYWWSSRQRRTSSP